MEILYVELITKLFSMVISETAVLTSSGEVMYLTNPTQEVQIDKDTITDTEKTIHSEFFEGRSTKTPERYLKIRNYIIDSW